MFYPESWKWVPWREQSKDIDVLWNLSLAWDISWGTLHWKCSRHRSEPRGAFYHKCSSLRFHNFQSPPIGSLVSQDPLLKHLLLNWKTNNMSCKPPSKYLPTVPKLNEERRVFEGGCRFSCNRLWLSLSWEKLAAKTSLPEYFSLLLTPNTFHILHPHYQRYLCLSV